MKQKFVICKLGVNISKGKLQKRFLGVLNLQKMLIFTYLFSIQVANIQIYSTTAIELVVISAIKKIPSQKALQGYLKDYSTNQRYAESPSRA